MKLKHLFSLSLSLSFVACQVSAPLVQPPIDPSIAMVSQTSVHHVQMPQEQIRVTLGSHSGFTTQEAQIDQLAFVQIMVTGDGISTPITSSDGLIPVTNGNVNAVVSGIPQNDGKIRFVEMQGYDANRQPLVGLKAKAWYRSQTNVNTLNITVSRAQILLVNVLKSLLVTRPNVLASLDIAALQTVLLAALGYDADTQTFAQQPETLSGAGIAALITTAQTIPDASTVREQMATLSNVSLTVTTENSAPIREGVSFVLNDAVSLPQVLSVDTASGTAIRFENVPEGMYTLEAMDNNGTVIASTTVSVAATVTITDDPLVLPLSAAVPVDTQVNTYTSNDQRNASIASDANGNFVVTWQSDGQDGHYGGIYAQRYSASGTPQGSEFRVNTYTTNNQNNPAVAMDADGDFVVTWTSANQEGEYGEDIHAQRYTASGAPEGSEFRINTYTTGGQTNPAVAMAADGDFVVTWESSAKFAGKNGIYAQRYAASGALQDSEFKVNTYTSSSQRDPAVAMAADGDFVVAWQTLGQDGSDDGIYAQRYDMTGASEGSEFRVNTYTSSAQSSPAVAMDADGDFVVTWQSYYQDDSLYSVYAQRYAASGGALGSEFKVNTYTSSSQRDPAVAMDADGDFVVTWQSRGQDGKATSVYAQRYDMTGAAEGSEFRVNAQAFDQSRPAVAIDADGDFVVAWQSYYQDGEDDGIYLARYSPLGVRK